MVDNFGLVSVSDYKGLTLNEAKTKAESKGFTTRVVEIDGKSLIVTHDLKNNRLNFRVKSDVIIDVYPG